MKSRAPEWKFLSLMAVAVLLLGVQAGRGVLDEDLSDPSMTEPSLEMLRAPASISANTPFEKKSPSFKSALLEWNWNCRQASPIKASVKGDNVRLKGRFCGANFSPQRLVIVNQSNGFTASIFEKGQQEYETDLIQLQQGSNNIHLEYQNSAGQKIESMLTILSSAL